MQETFWRVDEFRAEGFVRGDKTLQLFEPIRDNDDAVFDVHGFHHQEALSIGRDLVRLSKKVGPFPEVLPERLFPHTP